MYDYFFVLKVLSRMKDENWRKNSMSSLEPRSESSPYCTVSESRLYEMWFMTVDPLIRISVIIAKISEHKLWLLHASAFLHWRF